MPAKAPVPATDALKTVLVVASFGHLPDQEERRVSSATGIIRSMWTIFLLAFLAAVLGAASWLFFLWAVKSGQYDDPERPKHRMLDDDDEKER